MLLMLIYYLHEFSIPIVKLNLGNWTYHLAGIDYLFWIAIVIFVSPFYASAQDTAITPIAERSVSKSAEVKTINEDLQSVRDRSDCWQEYPENHPDRANLTFTHPELAIKLKTCIETIDREIKPRRKLETIPIQDLKSKLLAGILKRFTSTRSRIKLRLSLVLSISRTPITTMLMGTFFLAQSGQYLIFGNLKVNKGLLSLTRDRHQSHKIGSDASTLLWMGEKVAVRMDSPRVPGMSYPDNKSSTEIYTNRDPIMTHKAKLIAAIAACLFGIGCYLPIVSPALANTPPPNSTHLKPQIITLTGRIKKVEVEGGCYQLAADNGQNYELIGKFPKRDGIKVRLRGEVVKDIVTICQVGQPIKVKSVQIIRSK